jgi:hypothetical protein
VHGFTDIPDVPFTDGPALPSRRPRGKTWLAATRRWWATLSSMPHCVLWMDSDWSFARDTALLVAELHSGNVRVAAEVRHRERIMGTTADARLAQRIRYVTPVAAVEEPAAVATMARYRRQVVDDQYRDL